MTDPQRVSDSEWMNLSRKARGQKNHILAFYSSALNAITTSSEFFALPIDDHMVHRGRGVYDTGTVVHGNLYNFIPHAERLISSAKLAKIPCDWTVDDLIRLVRATVHAGGSKNCSVRIFISAGFGNFSISSDDCFGPVLYIAIFNSGDLFPRDPYTVTSESTVREDEVSVRAERGLKSVNYRANAEMAEIAKKRGGRLGIWLDLNGCVREGSVNNIAIVVEEQGEPLLITPPFDGVLPGCTLKHVFGILDHIGIKWAFRNFNVQDMYAAQEAIALGGDTHIFSIGMIDGKIIGDGTLGQVTKKIIDRIQSEIESGENCVKVFEYMEGRDPDSDLEEGAEDAVREAAMQWASDWRPGNSPPFGVHRVGDKEPPTFRAAVFMNGRPICGPIRSRIEDCITDRRQMLIQYRRITKMQGKRKTQAKYQQLESPSAGPFANLRPWVTHVRELLGTPRFVSVTPPLRHLAPVSLSVKIHGIPVVDRFLWSALLIDNSSKNPAVEALGYGAAALHSYCAALLIDSGVVPAYEFVTQVSAAVIQQLDLNRAAALVPEESQCIERSKGRKFDRCAKIDLSDDGVYEKIVWNCWAPDSVASEFIKHFCADYSVKPSATNSLLIQLISGAISHRQKFLDAQPHIHTALLRVFNNKRYEGRETKRPKKREREDEETGLALL